MRPPARQLSLENVITEPKTEPVVNLTGRGRPPDSANGYKVTRSILQIPIENLVRFAPTNITEGALPEFAYFVHLITHLGRKSPSVTPYARNINRRDFGAKAGGSLSCERGLGFDFAGTKATRYDRVITKASPS